MSEQPFTQDQVNELIASEKAKWEGEVLKPLQFELESLRPKKKSEQELEIERLKAEIKHQKVVSAFKTAGFDDFIDLVNVENEEDLQGKLDKLDAIMDARKFNNSFQPQDHKQTTAYDQAASKNDVVGMIGAKLGKLFN